MVLADGAQPEQSLLSAVHAKCEIHVEQYDVYLFLCHRFQDIIRLFQRQYAFKDTIQKIAHGCQDGSIVIYN